MSNIAEFERRITAALERIGSGLDSLAQNPVQTSAEPQVDNDELARLNEALEAEKMANAQLQERVNAIKDKQESSVQDMQNKIEELAAKLKDQETEVQKLKQVNSQLHQSNEELSKANEKSAADAQLINKEMQTELENLHATRKSDLAELETIMAELKPMISGAS